MKNIIILILLFCALSLCADIHGEIKLGAAVEIQAGYTEILIQYDFEFEKSILTFYGSWLTWFQFTEAIIVFAPFQDIYSVGAEYRINNMYFGIDHFCNHPVYSGYGILEDLRRGENLTTVSAGITW